MNPEALYRRKQRRHKYPAEGRRRESKRRSCAVPGCPGRCLTVDPEFPVKPYCLEHLDRIPRVRGILAELERREREIALAGSRQGWKAVDVEGSLASDVLVFLAAHGAQTIKKVAQQADTTVTPLPAAYAVVHALERAGLLENKVLGSRRCTPRSVVLLTEEGRARPLFELPPAPPPDVGPPPAVEEPDFGDDEDEAGEPDPAPLRELEKVECACGRRVRRRDWEAHRCASGEERAIVTNGKKAWKCETRGCGNPRPKGPGNFKRCRNCAESQEGKKRLSRTEATADGFEREPKVAFDRNEGARDPRPRTVVEFSHPESPVVERTAERVRAAQISQAFKLGKKAASAPVDMDRARQVAHAHSLVAYGRAMLRALGEESP